MLFCFGALALDPQCRPPPYVRATGRAAELGLAAVFRLLHRGDAALLQNLDINRRKGFHWRGWWRVRLELASLFLAQLIRGCACWRAGQGLPSAIKQTFLVW